MTWKEIVAESDGTKMTEEQILEVERKDEAIVFQQEPNFMRIFQHIGNRIYSMKVYSPFNGELKESYITKWDIKKKFRKNEN